MLKGNDLLIINNSIKSGSNYSNHKVKHNYQHEEGLHEPDSPNKININSF